MLKLRVSWLGEILRCPQDDNAFRFLFHVIVAQRTLDIGELKTAIKNPPMPPFVKVGSSEEHDVMERDSSHRL